MSNRRRLRPPAAIAATARAYKCGHCDSETGRPWLDEIGVWHLSVAHDDTCPVLGGTVSTVPAGLRATAAAAAETGQRALYLGSME